MNAHLLQALIFSLWAVLMLRLYTRATRMQQAVAMKKRKAHTGTHHAKPMAVRVSPLR